MTWPPSTAAIDSLPPFIGTCVNFTPECAAINSMPMCGEVLTPPVAYVTLLGSALAISITSCHVLAGLSALQTVPNW